MPTEAQKEFQTRCNACPAWAAWSIANLEGDDLEPVVRWFACGRHVHKVLTEADWETDLVQVFDLRNFPEDYRS